MKLETAGEGDGIKMTGRATLLFATEEAACRAVKATDGQTIKKTAQCEYKLKVKNLEL